MNNEEIMTGVELEIILKAGKILLSSGAEISRTEDTNQIFKTKETTYISYDYYRNNNNSHSFCAAVGKTSSNRIKKRECCIKNK